MIFAQPPLWLIVIAFILAIGPLVFIHEMGHYLVARWFGVGAEQFSIGFGREIAGWTDRRGTRWKIGWLPLGGYVRFVGDMNPASQADADADLSPSQREIAFHNKSWWKRFLIVLAGPMANFLLAIAIFVAFFMSFGVPSSPPVITGLAPGGAAEAAGLKIGDHIVEIANQSTRSFWDIRRIASIRPNENVIVRYERDRKLSTIDVRIGSEKRKDEFGQSYVAGVLGIQPPQPVFARTNLGEAVPIATRYTFNMTRSIFDVVGQIVTGNRSVKEMGGPLKMAQIAGQQASLGAFSFIQLLALFSINLGFINLLPVPMLDGGHLVFYAAEAVRRRPISARVQDWAFRGGLLLLLALILFTTVNDLASFGLFERLGRLIG